MKKFILGLFLILGAISFAAPKYINTSKLENTGYEITADDEDIFSIGKVTDVEAISILFYPMPDKTSKEVSDAVKSSAPDEVKFISSSENKRAYILKYKDTGEIFTYISGFVIVCGLLLIALNRPILKLMHGVK